MIFLMISIKSFVNFMKMPKASKLTEFKKGVVESFSVSGMSYWFIAIEIRRSKKVIRFFLMLKERMKKMFKVV